ncbi:MAG TPA: hypothetical protein VH593_12420 [Ktedonobacteraceae bacterium]
MSTSRPSSSKNSSHFPVIHISYECVTQKRTRESDTYHYEIACSISYPASFGHLSMKVTGQNTFRNAAAREVSFTRHEAGATTYVELLEAEQLEVRIVEQDGSYAKAFYYAHGQELTEQQTRRIVSTIQRIDTDAERDEKYRHTL